MKNQAALRLSTNIRRAAAEKVKSRQLRILKTAILREQDVVGAEFTQVPGITDKGLQIRLTVGARNDLATPPR